jgi:hypothetical protein
MERLKRKSIIAWIAVSISAVFANLWAYWGINENFHEGWYFREFGNNVILMFGQYLLMPIGFMLLAAVAIRWNKAGSILHALLALAAYWFFGKGAAGILFIALPLAGLGTLYWFGQLQQRTIAYLLVMVLPLLQIFGIGTYHAIRIAHRYNDNNVAARTIHGNGVALVWAPQGPGWPDTGTSWEDARRICAHLNNDGTSLLKEEVHIWRLPTVDEAVRSMVYHGDNAGGMWDSTAHKAIYHVQPDKESPLWNMYVKTIYWWTSTEATNKEAYIVVYNGGVWSRRKTLQAGYLNFRAVKESR